MLTLHIDTARTWRGGQNQALLTVLGLRGKGHRTVLVVHPHGELRRRASEGPDLLPLVPRSELDLAAAWRLARIVRELNPAIVHAHDPHGVAMAATALGFGRSGRRDSGHGGENPRLVASRRVDFALRMNAFSRWKYRQVSQFICASECIRQMLLTQDIEDQRTVTVHEGVDLEHVDAAPPLSAREAFWLPHNAPVIGCVGALVDHKGHRYLIRAAAQVVREVPDARFVVLGDGERRDDLTREIRDLGLERRVLLPGFRPDVLSLMKTFDVFVMPSISEGLGTSLLDAMACARPIIASRVGGIPEVVVEGETGLLVPPRDADSLAEAIVKVLEDRALSERLAAGGLARVRERFTVDRMVDHTLEVYERLTRTGAHARQDERGEAQRG